MKILYAIQGTGNGHLTRAMELVPLLKLRGETDVLVSGTQSDLSLPFQVNHRFKGLSFIFGKNGGVDLWNTYLKMNSRQLLKDINALKVEKYDLVVSDFEPVSAWACQVAGTLCIGLSNQVATLHPMAPKPPSNDQLGKLVLKHYAPTAINYGLHFKALDDNVFTPVIRSAVRSCNSSNKGHYTVYLPSYADWKIIKRLSKYRGVRWEVFSKHTSRRYRAGQFDVFPLETERFLNSMAGSAGVLCNAGFGTTSEALFLRKKLLVVPMKTQYEQHCNAAMLKSMGVPVVKSIKEKHADAIQEWLDSGKVVEVNYEDNSMEIINLLFDRHAGMKKKISVKKNPYSIFQ
ncbi:MAG: glycosyltransferase family protein [Bacteroidota bacterium]